MASLKKLVAQMTQVAFDAIGDLKDEVNYVQYISGEYDYDLSQSTYTFNYQSGIRGLFTTLTEQEKDNTIIVQKDKKFLVPAASFNLTLTDASEDTIIDSGGKEWNVVKYLGLTGGALHAFHVRKA